MLFEKIWLSIVSDCSLTKLLRPDQQLTREELLMKDLKKMNQNPEGFLR